MIIDLAVIVQKKIRMLIKISYCISLSFLCMMPARSFQQQSDKNLRAIHFRKCCEQNEFYNYDSKKCVQDDENVLSPKQYPINLIHDDFSA